MMQRWHELRCSQVGHLLGIDANCAQVPLPEAPELQPVAPPSGWRGLDRRVALAVHRHASPRIGWLMRRSTDVASGQIAVPVALTLVGFEVHRGRRPSARIIAITWIGGLLFHITVKMIYRRKRPALFPALTPAGGYSLPSGHTVTAVVTYGLAAATVAPFLPRGLRWLPSTVATAIVTSVATSRVYLGVHYPSDVLAGALIGLGWLKGSLRALARKYPNAALDA